MISVIANAGESTCASNAGPDGSIGRVITTGGQTGGSAVQVPSQWQCRYLQCVMSVVGRSAWATLVVRHVICNSVEGDPETFHLDKHEIFHTRRTRRGCDNYLMFLPIGPCRMTLCDN